MAGRKGQQATKSFYITEDMKPKDFAALLDRRSTPWKMIDKDVKAIIDDFGGPEELTFIQQQMIEDFAIWRMHSLRYKAKMVHGVATDSEVKQVYLTQQILTGIAGKLPQEKVRVMMDLDEYLRKKSKAS